MRAADHAWIAGKARCTFKSPFDTKTVEHSRHPFGPLDASAARRREPRLQCFVLRIDAEPDDMHGFALPSHRYLHAVYKMDAEFACRRRRFGKTAGVIVIGQCKRPNTAPRRARQQSDRRNRAVGHRRMAMQVGINQLGLSRSTEMRQGFAAKGEF